MGDPRLPISCSETCKTSRNYEGVDGERPSARVEFGIEMQPEAASHPAPPISFCLASIKNHNRKGSPVKSTGTASARWHSERSRRAGKFWPALFPASCADNRAGGCAALCRMSCASYLSMNLRRNSFKELDVSRSSLKK